MGLLGTQEDEERPHAVTAADLRALHVASAELPERAAVHRWRWMLNGGKLPALDSMGEVRVSAASVGLLKFPQPGMCDSYGCGVTSPAGNSRKIDGRSCVGCLAHCCPYPWMVVSTTGMDPSTLVCAGRSGCWDSCKQFRVLEVVFSCWPCACSRSRCC